MPGTIETLSDLHEALIIFDRGFDPDHPAPDALGYFATEIWHKCEVVIPILNRRGIDVSALERLSRNVTTPNIRAADNMIVGAIADLEGPSGKNPGDAAKLPGDAAPLADSLTDKQEQAMRYLFNHRYEILTAKDAAKKFGIHEKTLNKPSWAKVRAQLKAQNEIRRGELQMKTGPGSKTKGQLEAVARTTKR